MIIIVIIIHTIIISVVHVHNVKYSYHTMDKYGLSNNEEQVGTVVILAKW